MDQTDRDLQSPAEPKDGALFFWLLIVGALGLAAVFAFVAGGRQTGEHAAPLVLDIETGPAVAVLDVEGVILDTRAAIEAVQEWRQDEDVKALIVRINSPGGAVAPSQQLYDALRRFDRDKPAVAVMETVAASGGYYIAAGCREIWATRGTLTGSIGVIMQSMDISGLAARLGVTDRTIKSGRFKDLGNPFRTPSSAETGLLQGVIDDTYAQFIDDVLAGRPGLTRDQLVAIADGRVFTGRQALRAGLVDHLGSYHEALTSTARLAGITGEPRVVHVRDDWRKQLQKLLRELPTESLAAGLPGMWMVWRGGW